MDVTRAPSSASAGPRPRSSCSASPPDVASAGPYARSRSSSARAGGTPCRRHPRPARRRLGSPVVCLRSAAAHHGWELKTQPPKPEVMVRRGRKLSVEKRVGLAVHWANLADDQVEDGVTTPLRTIVDCSRSPSNPRPPSTSARARCGRILSATRSGWCSKPTRGPSTRPAWVLAERAVRPARTPPCGSSGRPARGPPTPPRRAGGRRSR